MANRTPSIDCQIELRHFDTTTKIPFFFQIQRGKKNKKIKKTI